MTRLICGKDKEGEEGHKDDTGNDCKSIKGGGEATNLPFLSTHNESSPKGQREQKRINIILELEDGFKVTSLYK